VTCERCGAPLERCGCPRDGRGKVLLPKDQLARVRRERRSGKIVTVIAGLDAEASDLAGMLKQFKSKLATGGTISEGAIELQGDHRDRAVEMLKAMGYPAKAAGG
jgi:translation initiation factor 1